MGIQIKINPTKMYSDKLSVFGFFITRSVEQSDQLDYLQHIIENELPQPTFENAKWKPAKPPPPPPLV